MYLPSFVLELHLHSILILSKTNLAEKFLFFLNFFCISWRMKTTRNVCPLTLQDTNQIHFPTIKDAVEENVSIFIVLQGDEIHTKEIYIIVKSIYSTQNLKSEATGSCTRIYWATVNPDKWLLSKSIAVIYHISVIISYS